jgi:hypothetical protein
MTARLYWLLARIALCGLWLCALAAPALAAPSVIKRVESMTGEAFSSYEAGDVEGAKTGLLDAIVLAKENGLGAHKAVARAYLRLALVHVDGLNDEEKGERYFNAALQIDPKIQIKTERASSTATRVLARVRDNAGAPAATKEAAAANEDAETKEAAEEPPAPKPAARAKEPAPVKEVAKAAPPVKEATRPREDTDKILKGVAEAREREVKEAKERDRKAKEEQDRILKELAIAREKEAKQKADLERQERDKLRIDLTQALDREKKAGEREAKLRAQLADLEATKQRLDEDLQVAKQRIDDQRRQYEYQLREAEGVRKQQEKTARAAEEALREEKGEVEKRLAAAEERERNERTAKEKLQEEKQLAEVRERQAKESEEKARQARDKLAEGPSFPDKLRDRVTCAPPDETTRGADVFIHCAPQGQIKAEELTLYYRPSGQSRFTAAPMERNRKGWHVAMVPAALVKGSMLQYYVEAHNERGRTVASTGKASHPHVLMVNRYPTQVAVGGGLTRANAQSRGGGK